MLLELWDRVVFRKGVPGKFLNLLGGGMKERLCSNSQREHRRVLHTGVYYLFSLWKVLDME